MREELYSVTRDEYVGFVKQLIPQNMHTEHIENDDETASLKIYANRDDTLIAEQYLNSDGIYEYYVYNMPANEDRRASKPVQKIVLETQEEVQAFFDILQKAMGKKND